ncbi:MAG: mechanosensitive ion channel family protein [Gemmatimonadaceae bacterium]
MALSRATVARIPSWYETLPGRWLVEYLPDRLLSSGPLEVLWWQWAALPAFVTLAVLLGALVSSAIRAAIGRLVRRTSSEMDDLALQRLGAPLTLACAVAVAGLLLPTLDLYPPATLGTRRLLRTCFLIAFFWGVLRFIDVARELGARTRWARASASSRTLLPLGARIAKITVVAIACVAILSLLGYPVASLIAGLGIGGLALALAAQKTVENLFGAFSIGVDQPFREGDFVRVDDFVGTVEAIGLRSTRFRTLDRTIVTLPNGRLADMRLESFAARDRMRLATVIGLVYSTPAHSFARCSRGSNACYASTLRSGPMPSWSASSASRPRRLTFR